MVTDAFIPVEALGRLSVLYERIREAKSISTCGVILFAGDNGISLEGTSRYEPLQTCQLVQQHLDGLAPTSRLLSRLGIPEIIVDVGLNTSITDSRVLGRKLQHGTCHFIDRDALAPEQVRRAIETGRAIGEEIFGLFDIIGVGELGIGDTLCAAALAAVVMGKPPEQIVGRGSADHKVIAKKTEIIYRAICNRSPDACSVTDILGRFGGLEIAALTGFLLGVPDAGRLVMLDGFVTAVAALLANTLDDRVRSCLIAPGLSDQRGHQLVLDQLGLQPVIDLGINYGEGLAAGFGLFFTELLTDWFH